MPEIFSNPLDYYAHPGLISDPGEFAPRLAGLPTDIPALVKVVQGLMIHIFWAERYGLQLSEARKQEVGLRWLPKMLKRILELDDRPLTEARPLDKKLVGNCRDQLALDDGYAAASRRAGARPLRLRRLLPAQSLRGSLGVRVLAGRRAALGDGRCPAGSASV